MSLADHFRELRNRVLLAVLGVLIASIVGWYFYEELINLLIQPLRDVRDSEGREIVNINFGASITQPFSVQLKVAIFVGIVLSSPVWIWQIWAFLLPGLTKQERRIALAYFLAGVPLFLAGAALAAWAIPRTVAILLSFTPDDAANLQDAMTYLNFVLYFILAFGLAFLMPVALVGLNQLRILSVRVMVRGWRVALMLILVFAAFVTPDPSAWTMLALAAPVFLLYWGAIGVAAIMERRRARKDPTRAWEDLSPDEASSL
ncbi:twin-arginine translocase subunit TatC [Ornithinimicrobium sp. F0845]|uniref:twin-arginine translocase subunit TatC n=1 Tax=Ornithinimicrobium sp. F0845 TaxID=2926412 RepID=UPI001FF3987A|nr:twin-arginine translocase subunit TatC [Ornithinimicrobium sp. F0845]MCK0113231.1 twin-arginine translocase subunit TatC [Ornithinimicrobium sp. F0845]